MNDNKYNQMIQNKNMNGLVQLIHQGQLTPEDESYPMVLDFLSKELEGDLLVFLAFIIAGKHGSNLTSATKKFLLSCDMTTDLSECILGKIDDQELRNKAVIYLAQDSAEILNFFRNTYSYKVSEQEKVLGFKYFNLNSGPIERLRSLYPYTLSRTLFDMLIWANEKGFKNHNKYIEILNTVAMYGIEAMDFGEILLPLLNDEYFDKNSDVKVKVIKSFLDRSYYYYETESASLTMPVDIYFGMMLDDIFSIEDNIAYVDLLVYALEKSVLNRISIMLLLEAFEQKKISLQDERYKNILSKYIKDIDEKHIYKNVGKNIIDNNLINIEDKDIYVKFIKGLFRM